MKYEHWKKEYSFLKLGRCASTSLEFILTAVLN